MTIDPKKMGALFGAKPVTDAHGTTRIMAGRDGKPIKVSVPGASKLAANTAKLRDAGKATAPGAPSRQDLNTFIKACDDADVGLVRALEQINVVRKPIPGFNDARIRGAREALREVIKAERARAVKMLVG